MSISDPDRPGHDAVYGQQVADALVTRPAIQTRQCSAREVSIMSRPQASQIPESDVPTVTVEMFKGRTRQQHQDLARLVTDAVVEALDVAPDVVRMRIVELERRNSGRGGVLLEDE